MYVLLSQTVGRTETRQTLFHSLVPSARQTEPDTTYKNPMHSKNSRPALCDRGIDSGTMTGMGSTKIMESEMMWRYVRAHQTVTGWH